MKTSGGPFSGTPRMQYILGLLAGLVVTDGFITDFVVRSGFAREVNPLLQVFIDNGNLLLLKMACGLLSALILWGVYKRRPKLALRISLFFIVFYIGIVYWSLAAFFIAQA